jgi:bacteriocin biosynthesis cyclodehydratase domain-containing protein
VVVEGAGPTAELVRARLSEAGIRCPTTTTTTATTTTDSRPDLAVMIAHHVLSPEQHGRWLRRDVPHLPVLFGDQLVHVGPLIEPGTSACLHCLTRYRTDADPAWPAIASQLWGRPADTETALMAGEVAALTVRAVLRRLDGIPSPDEITVDVVSGERRSRQWWQHPGCGCAGLPDLGRAESATTSVRRESDSASAPPRDPIPIGPRRGGAVAARA